MSSEASGASDHGLFKGTYLTTESFLEWSLTHWWTNGGLGKDSHEELTYRNNLSDIHQGVKNLFKVLQCVSKKIFQNTLENIFVTHHIVVKIP
jgi:hypothetical protein